jgi:hypothetical protein
LGEVTGTVLAAAVVFVVAVAEAAGDLATAGGGVVFALFDTLVAVAEADVVLGLLVFAGAAAAVATGLRVDMLPSEGFFYICFQQSNQTKEYYINVGIIRSDK